MEIEISKLSNAVRKIAIDIDNEGIPNDKIEGAEVPVFKAAFAFLVRQYKASDFEYRNIFGDSAYTEWKQINRYDYSGQWRNESPIYEYQDKEGNIIRGSIEQSGVIIYTESIDGYNGYYGNDMIKIPQKY